MRTWRVRITGARERPDVGRVAFDVVLEQAADESESTWDPLLNGTRTITLTAADILAITTNEALTTAEKQQGIMALLEAEISEMQLTQAQHAREDVEALLPAGWPVTFRL